MYDCGRSGPKLTRESALAACQPYLKIYHIIPYLYKPPFAFLLSMIGLASKNGVSSSI